MSKFELTLILRDQDGNPTGKKKTISTDDINILADFWHRNQPKKKRKKRKDKGAASAKEAEKILKEVSNNEV